jgi:RNA polymerase sigma-70 factor, ECF subfamily
VDVDEPARDDGGDGRDRTVREPEPATIRAAADGDRDAFADLVRYYEEPIWRFLVRLVGDGTVAEDLAQETFLRAYDRLDGFRFQARFSTWLYRFARNLAIDELRARDRRDTLPDRRGPGDVDRPGAEQSTEVTAALASLSRKLRETIVLVEVAGLSCREAAEILGIAEGTVKSRCYHARQHLAAWFRSDQEAADGP